MGVIGWWMLRPEKNNEMKELWNRKWNVPVTTAEETVAEATRLRRAPVEESAR